MSDCTENGTVAVDGAHLFYKCQGRGPLLLLCAGGGGDADSFDALAAHLKADFTVVAYDRRGYARSPRFPADDGEVIPIARQSADALALLTVFAPGPAFVFGSSLGAVIGLDLTLRHPQAVRLLLAHEPPLNELRDTPAAPGTRLADFAGLPPDEALARFGAALGVTRDGMDSAALARARGANKAANAEFFLSHEAPAVGRFRLDREALRREAGRIVFGGGEAGRSYFPYQCAARAAEISGARFAEFPGHHAGYVQHPHAFAERLRAVLAAT